MLSASGSYAKPEESSNQSGAGKRNFYSQPLPPQDAIGDYGAPSALQTFQSMSAPLDPRLVVQVSINAMLDDLEEKERKKRDSQSPTAPTVTEPDHQRVTGIPSDSSSFQQG